MATPQIHTKNNGAKIIEPDFTLKEKVGRNIDLNQVLNIDVMAGAQFVIERQKEDIHADILANLTTLQELFTKISANPRDVEAIEAFADLTLSIKSYSGMIGYPLATAVAKSLFAFTKGIPQVDNVILIIMNTHLQTIKAIYRDNIRMDGGETGRQLLAELAKITAPYTAKK